MPIYFPNPTWPLHKAYFLSHNLSNIKYYPYYDFDKK